MDTGMDPAKAADRIEALFDAYPYLFCLERDGDTYAWLSELGRYSPIVHLQQTDGKSSGHRPFTREWNERGIIEIPRVLQSLMESYRMAPDNGLPPPCKDIFVTIEVFSSTADIPYDIQRRLEESVEHIRRYIPQDGLTLDRLVETHKEKYAPAAKKT